MIAPLPPNEDARLKAVRLYDILDTAAEQVFDDITLIASQVCGTPMAAITILDENRQWFKSRIGLSGNETPRDAAFCAHTILQTDVLVVSDARLDERFSSNPLVTGAANVRFYAGVPLLTSEGHALGTVCVIDREPRVLTSAQLTTLQALGRQVVALLEMRRRLAELRQSEARFAGAFEHAPIGVALVSPEGRWLKVNPALCELVGYTAAELLVRTFQDITLPEDLAIGRESLRRVLSGDVQTIQVEKRYVHRQGHIVPILLNVSLVRDAHGRPLYSVAQIQDITARKKAEEALRLLGSALEQSKESILITDAELDPPGPRIVFVNPAFAHMTGFAIEEVLGQTPRILQGIKTDKSVLRRLRENLSRGVPFSGEAINYRKDGLEFLLEWHIAPLRQSDGKITHFVAIQRDVTERRRLEARLFQAQKMETVGKLAGGIAHEFNSILTAIIGQSELLLGDLPAGTPLARSAAEINRAADRAAALTRQLLAYGRKQMLHPVILDLNGILAGMARMLDHLMGGDVQTRIITDPALWKVKADAGQIEQVITNLTMNAHEAMPKGGRLTLETTNISFDQQSMGHSPELEPGDYVMLAISDTGIGMSEATKARVFEPFFSTKDVGQGIGLGLSTCDGIVKQSGGHIAAYSEPGRGTTFKVYLPRVAPSAETALRSPASPSLPCGAETVLLVEDDPALREMETTLLRRLGYTVMAAANGLEALNSGQRRDTGHIDLLFTDVVMPHMSGQELAARIRAMSPHTRVLYASAYTEHAIAHQGLLLQGEALLTKPFTPSALAHKLREVLGNPFPTASALPEAAPVLENPAAS